MADQIIKTAKSILDAQLFGVLGRNYRVFEPIVGDRLNVEVAESGKKKRAS